MTRALFRAGARAVDLWMQLTGKANGYQVRLDPKRRYGLLINMGGNDKTVVFAVFRAAA